MPLSRKAYEELFGSTCVNRHASGRPSFAANMISETALSGTKGRTPVLHKSSDDGSSGKPRSLPRSDKENI
jgi:hypothetical protein